MTSPLPESLVGVLENSVRKFGARDLFGKRGAGGWVYTTYSDFGRLVDDLRGGMASLGVGRGDKVGIIANNRIEWAAAAYASYGLSAAFVPMYESQLERDWEYIVADAELKVLLVANEHIFEKTRHLKDAVASLRHFVLLGGAERDGLVTYEELLRRGRATPV